MSSKRQSLSEPRSAAERFVASAAGAASIDESADDDAALLRCAAAVTIARGLADDPELRWAYEEAASIASRSPVRGSPRRRLAWAGAGLAAATVAAGAIVFSLRAPPRAIAEDPPIASRADCSSLA